MSKSRAKQLALIGDNMFGQRRGLLELWQELADNFYPERANFTQNKTDGVQFVSELFDSDPPVMRRDFGNWLGSVLRPAGREWFKLKVEDEQAMAQTSEKLWLERVTSKTRSMLYSPRSQFIDTMALMDHDYVTFGNCVFTVQERDEKDGIIFQPWHLRDCAWTQDYYGIVDGMWRRCKYTARNLKRRFRGNVHENVTKCLEKDPEKEFEVLHIEVPFDDYDLTQKQRRYKDSRYVSIYWDCENQHLLEERDIMQFNYVVSRWFKVNQYAYSPCATLALPDGRTMQALTRIILEAGEKAVDPPLIATHEAVIGGLNVYSGGITYVDKEYDERFGESVRPLPLGKAPEAGVAMRQDMRNTLSNVWFLNKLFLPNDHPEMTAEEVMRRDEEFLRVSQPIIEPAGPQRNGLMLEAVTSIGIRGGYYRIAGPLPENLKRQSLTFAYDNPVEDARKRVAAAALQRTIALTMQVQEMEPVARANVNWNKAHREAVIADGLPVEWMNDEKTAAEGAKGIKQAQAAQEMGMVAEKASEIAGNVAPLVQAKKGKAA